MGGASRSVSGRFARSVAACLAAILVTAPACLGTAPIQLQQPQAPSPARDSERTPSEAPAQVQVQPTARDEQISSRLNDILRATGWFEEASVRVDEGVVFLSGRTETDEFKAWAGNLARNTQDVAAVVNKIEVIPPPPWDFQPAIAGLRDLQRSAIRALPYLAFGILVLLLALAITRLTSLALRGPLKKRIASPLLRDLIARGVGLAAFLMGLFIVFQVAGLTSFAFTVMGGTGLLGLILGIAFRGITENFLASIFLSLQPPFRAGDLVEISDTLGYIQRLTTRATVLMTLEGNHVQIPNSTVYTSNIKNYTSNPNRRLEFTIGIGYDDPIARAQEVAMNVLTQHPTVLKDPEPWVLVDNLGPATVNLKVYFWLNGRDHSWLKVKSSVIRLIKLAFQKERISMPDEARELIFPRGIPVTIHEDESVPAAAPGPAPGPGPAQREPPDRQPAEEPETVSTHAEAGLRSESNEINAQARHSRSPEESPNLLDAPSRPPE